MGSIMYQNQAYGNQLCPLEVTRNGVYIPPTGYNGFSVADIKVGGAELVLEWDFTKSMDEQNYPDVPWTKYYASYTQHYTRDEYGLHLNEYSSCISLLGNKLSNIFDKDCTIDIEFGNIDIQDATETNRLFMPRNSNSEGLIYKGADSMWKVYVNSKWWNLSETISDPNYFSNSILRAKFEPGESTSYNRMSLTRIKNGVSTIIYNHGVYNVSWDTCRGFSIGSDAASAYNVTVKKITVHTGLMLRDGSQED